MKLKMKFSDNIKSILLKRNGTRKGGEVFSVKENQLDIKYSVDLRELVDVAVKKMVSDMNYYYIDDRSTDKELFFLDLSRERWIIMVELTFWDSFIKMVKSFPTS